MAAAVPAMADDIMRETSFDAQHEDMIHDVQVDYYGKLIATCSSDRTIRIFKFSSEGGISEHIQTLSGHEGEVWQVGWSNPKFGNMLASCGNDGRIIVWKEVNGVWIKYHEYRGHTASVNSVSWAPPELGAMVVCGSSDGKVSILNYDEEKNNWEVEVLVAHSAGCNSVSWAPSVRPGSLTSTYAPLDGKDKQHQAMVVKKFASGGCDNLIKIWNWNEGRKSWVNEDMLEGHSDWVRDVAWAPSLGLPRSYLASCSQDRTAIVWTKDEGDPSGGEWKKHVLKGDVGLFEGICWRVSWSTAGNLLAVSCGNNSVSVWKESLNGEWECVKKMSEAS